MPRVPTESYEVEMKQGVFQKSEVKKGWGHVCPVCNKINHKPIEVDKPYTQIAHCPHCKEIVTELQANRLYPVEGSVFLGGKDDWEIHVSEYLSEERALLERECWHLACPKCLKTIEYPSQCYASQT